MYYRVPLAPQLKPFRTVTDMDAAALLPVEIRDYAFERIEEDDAGMPQAVYLEVARS
jgi:hypothetical protein